VSHFASVDYTRTPSIISQPFLFHTCWSIRKFDPVYLESGFVLSYPIPIRILHLIFYHVQPTSRISIPFVIVSQQRLLAVRERDSFADRCSTRFYRCNSKIAILIHSTFRKHLKHNTSMMEIQEKTVLITGGANGIGYCTARELLRSGVKVI